MFEIRLLGPFAVVRDDGSVIPVRGKRRAALLAALALSPGAAASRDRLIDAVWGDHLPAKPTHALESLVSQLRRNLADPSGDCQVIEGSGGGYALDPAVFDTDVRKFRESIDEGRHAQSGGDPACAVVAFSRALELWRGRPLDGVELNLDAVPVVTELEELRLLAVESRYQGDLDLGNHDRVIADLQTLTKEEPFRERPWGMLMLALYRAGRQTEALRTLQEARKQLADVGAEPGLDLRSLEDRILQQDPSLQAPARPIDADDTPTKAPSRHTVVAGPVGVTPARTNLPAHLSSFVGRTEQLEELDALVGSSRLVTLTGVGGTGKTRLSHEIARRVAERFDGGVWMVELAGIADPGLVLGEIADVWGLRAGEGATLDEVIADYLADKHLLVILDNCEHVLDTAVYATRRILDHAPGVSILATSRESLGIAGEVVYAVPPLALPPDVDHATGTEAVELFLERAQAVRGDVTVTSEDMAAVVEICGRVDGIPLGIELAAARLRSMTPTELLTRLNDSLAILSGKSVSARQRTINATIGWSYDLLKPETQTLFRRLSVFAGGFDIDAAEAVGAGGRVEDWAIVERIDDLVDKSLVVAEMDSGTATRFRLLEPVRQYAAERLRESGEADEISLAHARHLAAMCATAMPHLHGPRQPEWMEHIDADYDNIRAALATLLAVGDLDCYLQACWNLYRYWYHDGLHLEGIEFLLAGLESSLDADPLTRVKAWIQASDLANDITLRISIDYAQKSLEFAEQLGNPHALGRAKMALGFALSQSGRWDEGPAWTMSGEELVVQHPDPTWFPDPVWARAYLDMYCGWYYVHDHPDKAHRFKAGIDGFIETGDPAMIARAQACSITLTGLEDDDWILEQLARAIDASQRGRHRIIRPHALTFWAGVALRQGKADEVVNAVEEAARLHGEIGDTNCMIQSIVYGAAARIALERLDEADHLLGKAAHIAIAHDDTRLGASFTAEALDLAIARGDLDVAVRFLGRAETHWHPPQRTAKVAEHRKALEASLGDRFEALVQAGAAMSDRDVIAKLAEAWD